MNTARSLASWSTGRAPSPAKLSHIVIRTGNLAKLRGWYLTVLNAKVSYENEMVCFMTYDDEHHRVGIVQLPGIAAVPQGPPVPGLEHVSFAYADLGQLLATYRWLKGQGIEPFWTINHGPTISLYYRDPDGNKAELQVDVFNTTAAVNEFLDREYPENFMGIIIDPEELIRRYESGVSLEELYHRPKLPPGMTPWDMFRP
jgi:catechol 2,3-dioxygenase-like lactoylglutathione lyase family enzyme